MSPASGATSQGFSRADRLNHLRITASLPDWTRFPDGVVLYAAKYYRPAPTATAPELIASIIAMNQILRFPASVKRDPAITAWMNQDPGELRAIARHWFDVIRDCGTDVRELLHDGHPTACVADAAFAYVNAYTAHVNVGFFRGADLEDPDGLLEGTGKYMRHVKLRPGGNLDARALIALIESAYTDIRRRLEAE